MYLLLLVTLVLAISVVNAENVTWSYELLESDGSNVIAMGTEHVGVSYGSGSGDSRIINGVNFKANDGAGNHDNPNWSGWIDNRNGSSTRYGAAGTDLKELTNDIVYGGNLVLGINNLTIGNTYMIQIISFDADNWWNQPEAAIERWQSVAATGDSDFLIQHGTDSPYNEIDDVGASLVIGVWTADSIEIDFTINGMVGEEGNMNDNAILNAFVVQDISPRAINMAPFDNETGVFATRDLQWMLPRDPYALDLPYTDTASFVVYCDPNEALLKAATYDNHENVLYYSDQLLTGTIEDDQVQSFDLDPDMDINTTYYWRVDTRFASASEPNDVVEGNVWVFNTDAKPVITSQPDDLLIFDTEDAELQVTANDPTGGDLNYQWYFNGIETENKLEGEIYSTLTLANPLSDLDQGYYSCKITNTGGDTWTRSAFLVFKDIVNHWEMDGTTVDSINGYDGTFVGDPNSSATWVEGIVGTDSIILEEGEGVAVILDENYPVLGSQLTVSVWVWADTRPSWASVIKNWSDSLGGMIHLGLNGSGNNLNVQITQSDGNEVSLDEIELFPIGKWQHIAATADGSKLRLYRNGMEVGTAANYDGTLLTEIPYISIGYKTGNDGKPSTQAPGYWNGKIDDVRIYNYGLGHEEIAQVYYDVTGTRVCLYPPDKGDFDSNCQIDLADFAILAAEWLDCGYYPVETCLE